MKQSLVQTYLYQANKTTNIRMVRDVPNNLLISHTCKFRKGDVICVGVIKQLILLSRK